MAEKEMHFTATRSICLNVDRHKKETARFSGAGPVTLLSDDPRIEKFLSSGTLERAKAPTSKAPVFNKP